MYHVKKGNFEYLVFRKLSLYPQIVHGVFLRRHNFKQPHIHEEIRKTFVFKGVAYGKQVHGISIANISDARQKVQALSDTDGLITKQQNVALCVHHADCQATLLFDPKNLVISAVHSGWRGSSQNIYEAAVQNMEKNYGTSSKDLIVCIGPSLGPMAAEFVNFQKELPQNFYEFQIKPTYFDFWSISEKQFMDLGVPKKNIEIARICTFSNPSYFFSYRRDKGIGNHGTFIAIK